MLALALLTLAAAHAGEPELRTVRVELTETHPYCGGAAPGPEQVARAQTAVPVVGRSYLVRTGTENKASKPLMEVTTDAAGRLELRLRPGSYCLVTPSKRELFDPKRPSADAVVPPHTDLQCLAAASRTCDLTLDVPADADPEPLRVHQPGRCSWRAPPCYDGPPRPGPPSAAPRR